MGNVGGGEILVILLAALIFLGPEKLPEVARQIGKVVGEVRKVSAGFQREVHDAMRMVEDATKVPDTPRPTPALDVTSGVDHTPTDTAAHDSAAHDSAAHDTAAEATPPAATEVLEVLAAESAVLDTDAAPAGPTSGLSGTVEPGPVTVAEPTGPASAAPPLPADVAHGGDR